MAYTLYRDGTCDCGWPRHICQHPDNDGWFTAHSKTCHNKAAVERLTGAKNYKPEPGQLVYTTYDRPADKPLAPPTG